MRARTAARIAVEGDVLKIKPQLDIYKGRSPEEVPACTVREAASWLGLPYSTTRAWVLGQKSTSKGKDTFFDAVVEIADPERHLLSFRNLVELHVLAAIRREHEISLQAVRRAVEYMQDRLKVRHPLAHERMFTLGKDLLVEHLGQLLNVSQSGQSEMRVVVETYLRRVVRNENGSPVRLFPFSRIDIRRAPQSIVIDPRVQFGRPCLTGTGIPTSVIAERYKAGETIAEIAHDYGRKPLDVEEAVRYELKLAA